MTSTSISQPDGILFDLDGVIANVAGSYRECIIRTAADFGCEVNLEDIDAAKRLGNANDDWILTRDMLAIRGVGAALEDVIQRFQGHYLGVPGLAGLCERETLLIEPDLLRDVTQRYPSAIVTGRPRKDAKRFLQAYRIEECFRYVVAMEDAPSKPSPDGIRLAMGELGLDSPWMIGDTPDDMNAAVAAGITPIGVASGPGYEKNKNALLASGAVVVFSDINDIKGVLN